jgi:ferredoxin
MKLRVDRERCQGHARCQAIAPEVFEVDDVDQKSRVKLDALPPELDERAWRAIRTCPEGAIHAEK